MLLTNIHKIMVLSCVSYNCTNRFGKLKENGKKLQFHKFPFKNPELLEKWIIALKRESWQPSKCSRLCGEHFSEDDYKTPDQRYLKDEAVPSIFNFSSRRKKIKGKSKELSKQPLPIRKKRLKARTAAEIFSQDKNQENMIDKNDMQETTVVPELEDKIPTRDEPILSFQEQSSPVKSASEFEYIVPFQNESILSIKEESSPVKDISEIEDKIPAQGEPILSFQEQSSPIKGTSEFEYIVPVQNESILSIKEESSPVKDISETEDNILTQDEPILNFQEQSSPIKIISISPAQDEPILSFQEQSPVKGISEFEDIIPAQCELNLSFQEQSSPDGGIKSPSNHDESSINCKISQISCPTIISLRRKAKILQQRLKRRDKEIAKLKSMLSVTQKMCGMTKDTKDRLQDNFKEIPFELLTHQIKNKTCKPNGRRYSSSMKEFALTLYSYSRRSYNYLGKFICLPHPAMVRAWAKCARRSKIESFNNVKNLAAVEKSTLDSH